MDKNHPFSVIPKTTRTVRLAHKWEEILLQNILRYSISLSKMVILSIFLLVNKSHEKTETSMK